jgi:hypothetical protein
VVLMLLTAQRMEHAGSLGRWERLKGLPRYYRRGHMKTLAVLADGIA